MLPPASESNENVADMTSARVRCQGLKATISAAAASVEYSRTVTALGPRKYVQEIPPYRAMTRQSCIGCGFISESLFRTAAIISSPGPLSDQSPENAGQNHRSRRSRA
jgi:hypothetical protein